MNSPVWLLNQRAGVAPPGCPPRGMSEVDKLGTVERYFVEVKGIPRLAERIRCFIFSRTYAATRAKVGIVRGAADSVQRVARKACTPAS